MTQELLSIRGLKTIFASNGGTAVAVDGINLSLKEGETLGLVGESGCGKTVTALSIMRLVSDPGKIVEGEIIFEGHDLLSLSEEEMREVRGDRISMIFQEPMTSLNPVFRIQDQIGEVYRVHRNMSKSEARDAAIVMLKKVGIPSPEKRSKDYPHQMSGGMRQRVMIAMALACDPKLMLADEPTTALDVTIQAQILELMNEIKHRLGTGIILITHDLGVVAEMVDRVAVMYAGKIVEEAPVNQLFASPQHPYTIGLLKSVPRIDEATREASRLHVIPGMVPDLRMLPEGCSFRGRCPEEQEICKRPPALEAKSSGSRVRCWMRE
ncbi:ABC transporter ATP-binding protein [Desulfomonile tiedjei]|uniref:Oligopeptide/dipeptide ABC transporter, ATP-binding protein n=1 Tax=Desulfomonile tiedjei (strain ATCC 49306 / DSM 6799 / DCB-1) TaxID=706587 RepID=I4C3H7_DESTA|nr:ABC transporter ATP-binding protein [Desulfomonile tiedjei]AFM24118.1 oligopeptide/dipeptide ABC transporter, ATP-binding protein [Desulfomonile tiedjei DSM 6799]